MVHLTHSMPGCLYRVLLSMHNQQIWLQSLQYQLVKVPNLFSFKVVRQFLLQFVMERHIANDFKRDRLFGKDVTNVIENKLLRNRNSNLSRKALIVPREISEDQFKRNQSHLEKRNRLPSELPQKHNLTINPPMVLRVEKSAEPQTSGIFNDIQCVPDYFQQNLNYMLENQKKAPPISEALTNQTIVNETMRTVLLDWLIGAHLSFKMFPNTIFITANLIDQYLLCENVPHSKLQLVGASCFFTAAKYEETYCVPELSDVVDLCAKAFTKNDFLQMESQVLKALEFNLIVETSFKFLQPLAKLDNLEGKGLSICKYLLELTLFSLKIQRHRASLLASASIYLSNRLLKKVCLFGDNLVAASGYDQFEVRTCAKEILALWDSNLTNPNMKNLRKKYSLPAYHEVSKMKPEKGGL